MIEPARALLDFGFANALATEILGGLVTGAVGGACVALVQGWLADARSDRLLAPAYRAADQAIVEFLTAGAMLARLEAKAPKSGTKSRLQSASGALERMRRQITTFERTSFRVVPALSVRAFDRRFLVEQGLGHLKQRYVLIAPHIEAARDPAAALRDQSISMALKVWMDLLELVRNDLSTRDRKIWTRRPAETESADLELEVLFAPTGQLAIGAVKTPQLAKLARVIWGRRKLDRIRLKRTLVDAPTRRRWWRPWAR